MKSKLYRNALLSILIISLSGAFSVSAQSPDRPAPPEIPVGLEKGSEPTITPFSLQHPGLAGLRPSMATRSSSPGQSAVLTGQPGLSYRHVQTFGQSEVGYQTDGYHLNAPGGLFIDGSNNLYVTEDHGYRVLRYSPAGVNNLSIGVAGLCVEGINPNRFCTPRDIATDATGNLWIATGHRVVKFNSSGVYQTQLPVPSSSGSWSSGASTTQFKNATGVAVDSANNRLFVADRDNHRVQVYNISSGSPVYSMTLGVTGYPAAGNSNFNQPTRLAVNSSGQLFVVDTGNNRIQLCTISGFWSCQPFVSSSLTMKLEGIALDSSNQPHFYDSIGKRVMRCTSADTCLELIPSLDYTQDLAVDSSGNVYIGAYGSSRIRKYDSAGTLVLPDPYIGAANQSYFPDGDYIFSPWGVAVSTDGSLYVGEYHGHRLLKFNAAGVRQWAAGDPGGEGALNGQFKYPAGKPAIAANGNIYFPDTYNHRIQIYDSSGSFQSSFGGFGFGNAQFKYPTGISISPVDGDIYVADRDNQRIQVYDSNFQYEATLGITGLAGAPPEFFNTPYDVAVDASNNIYVADHNNYRVQKCTRSASSYSCSTFAGETGTIIDGYFDYLRPAGVVVDGDGHVLVVDDWNNRIQVFDMSGAYLTTIGGSWGARSGQFRGATGIAVDAEGNVYVSDFYNNRVQKYSPGVPGWAQANINAFGDMNNWNVNSLMEFNSQLYAGTYSGSGAQLWRMNPSGVWSLLIWDGFGDLATESLSSLMPFNANLYAGMYNANGASILRSADGEEWFPVVTEGLNDLDNIWAEELAVFNGQIYAGIGNPYAGGRIWRSSSGNAGTWSTVVTNGYQSPNNWMFRSSAVHGTYLYFGSENTDINTWSSSTGGVVIRSNSGNQGSWVNVSGNGFGSSNNYVISGLASFGGYLYASTGRWDTSGIQVWRCQTCNQSSDWVKVVDNGFGDPDNWGISTLQVFNNQLFLIIGNSNAGVQVWRSSTGNSGEWEQVNLPGFGDSENAYPYANSSTVFNNQLFVGVENAAHGPEIWKLTLQQIFLPLTVR